jgi:hypothetical protein
MGSEEIERIRRVLERFTHIRLPRDPRDLAARHRLRLAPTPHLASMVTLNDTTIAYNSSVSPNDECILIARGVAMHVRKRFAGSIVDAFTIDELGEALYPTLSGNRGAELVTGSPARPRS